jgi:hypothetical protein
MNKIASTLNKLHAYILNDSDFQDYYKQARQLKNLKGYKYFIKQWLGHYLDNPQWIALIDKPYLDYSYVIINDNIIDLDSLFIDYKSDLRAYFQLNPKSL